MVKGLVYTALYGQRDKPLRIRAPEPNVDYLMFSDGHVPKGWKEVHDKPPANPRLAARVRKVQLPAEAEGYDWVLWIDASHIPQVPIARHVEEWLADKDFAAYRHHHWDCTYTEIKHCKRLGKDKPERLDRCEAQLRSEGLPEHYGQIASTILARRVGSEIVEKHGRCWDHWVREMSIRDQVSFMHCLWILAGDALEDLPLHYIGANAFRNELFHYQGGHG